MRVYIVCLVLWGINGAAFGQTNNDEVRFFGKNPEYAGFNLVFERYSNFIIPQTEPLVTLAIDDDGEFDFTFPLNETLHAFVDLGRYRASIYLEPGLSYQLVLPPFEPKNQAERLNPFFQPEEVLLGIANEEARALNRNIVEFDAMFEFNFSRYATDLFVNGNVARATEIEEMLEERFTFDHPVFNRHKQFIYMKLWRMTVRRQNRTLIHRYMSNQAVDYHLPVYWEVFNDVFKGFFPNNLAEEVQQPILRSISRRESFNSIADIAVQDTIFKNREFAEVMLLYSLYEAFYQENLAPETVFAITSDAVHTASTPETREMARQFHRKLSMLRTGTEAPGFTLLDREGNYRSLEDFRGKFVYLNFMHTANFSALRDMQSLVRIQEVFREQLHVVTIIVDEDFEAMTRFLDRHPSYDWTFLHFASAPTVLFDYNIMAVPAYYLINPEGVLSLSPAPTPDENFRARFADRYRSWQREQLRRNPPERRSIFR
ncbi:TlpA family protein disulfide reductase [Natronoflexus pectinivorans]|uniref:AhpC/TSA family protein n=1 Tax=Natronoflexus pectinivorans TaxID=682526 RepID=A0A4V2RWW9_9BACT|nr:TlpA disulfide reductase family protein [Natronoflexus pectinivorans]TCO10541.1 AhpC/TSA family protein [Natronoflexus pectinivorans]